MTASFPSRTRELNRSRERRSRPYCVRRVVEAGTPSVLFRRGFTKASLVPGTKVKVDGYQAKDGTHRANGRDLTFPDGKKLFMGSSGTGAPYELARPGVDTEKK